MKFIILIIVANVVTGCATQKAADIPDSWIEKEVSIEYVHEYFYSLCKNIEQRSVYVNGEPKSNNRTCEKGSGNPFDAELEEPYQVFFARSPRETWESLSGWAGFVLVKEGKQIELITTAVN